MKTFLGFLTKLNKKRKYFVYSTVVSLLLYKFSVDYEVGDMGLKILFLLFAVCIVGIFFTQYPGINLKNAFPLILLPAHLLLGSVFSLIYFPNLSLLFKVGALTVAGIVLYVINLVNNIYVVIEDKQVTIPLFRVASTWSQILIVIVAIPFFAGIFKTPFNVFEQNSVVAVSSFLFTLYLIWTLSFDKEVPSIEAGESVLVSLLVSFLVFTIGISVSFVPTESFLRALLASSTLMLGVSYIQAHYKNRVTKALLAEYGVIVMIFFLFVLIFKP